MNKTVADRCAQTDSVEKSVFEFPFPERASQTKFHSQTSFVNYELEENKEILTGLVYRTVRFLDA